MDELYINAQRELINSKISVHLIKSFSDYTEKIDILMQRPAPDLEYMETFFENMDINLLNNLGLRNPELSSVLKQKLQEYREISSSYAKYGNKDIYEFEILGRKIGIDKDRNLYGAKELLYQATWNPNTGIYEFKAGNESVKLDISQIDFKNWKTRAGERQKEIAQYFSRNAKDDVKSVEQVAKNDGLVKLEKFTLPSVGGKKTPTVIYVATYNDRIEVLNNPAQIGTMENINLAQYIGVTSLDPKVGAIYSKPLGSIDNGIVYSKYNQKYLHSGTIQSLAKKITPTLTEEQIDKLVEQYKASDEYDVEDNLSQEQLQEFAIVQYAKSQYDRIPYEQKKELYDKVVKSNDRFIISTKDGRINVSLLFGDEITTAFQGQSVVLVDTKGKGLYNEQFEILSRSATVKTTSNPSVIKTNKDGNIIFPQMQRSYIKQETRQQVLSSAIEATEETTRTGIINEQGQTIRSAYKERTQQDKINNGIDK